MTRTGLSCLLLCFSLATTVGCPQGVDGSLPRAEQGLGLDGDGYCAVQQLFELACYRCHSPSRGPLGELDLQSDPELVLVDQRSAFFGERVLLVPGDPGASFLLDKLEGSEGDDEGTPMPPSELLTEADIDVVRTWIAEGADFTCSSPGDDDSSDDDDDAIGAYHPDGWADPFTHGQAFIDQTDECRTCHGDQLDGGTSTISCDDCHQDGWRTDCTYCHGGTQNTTGAPPRDVHGEEDPNLTTFRAHGPHVVLGNHAPFDCTMCHVKPTDVLSDGHVLDDTPGVAEVSFAGGLSPQGVYDGAGGCSNLYCHGDGRGGRGARSDSDPTPGCGECHASSSSPQAAWSNLSGQHSRHLGQGLGCGTCHPATAAEEGEAITGPESHVNGTVEVAFPSGFTYGTGFCFGLCHGRFHLNGW